MENNALKQHISKRLEIILVAILLIIGASLRLCRLGHKSLWFDELFVVEMGKLPFAAQEGQVSFWTAMRTAEAHPPLYHLMMKAWTGIVGDRSEFWTRFPSAVLGILCLAFFYYFMRSFFDRPLALAALAFGVFSPAHLAFSQIARMYMPLTLTTLFSLFCLFKVLQGHKKWLWGYVLGMLAGLYLQYLSFFTLGAFGALLGFWTLKGRLRWRDFLLAHAAIAAGFVPWAGNFLAQFSSGAGWPSYRPPLTVFTSIETLRAQTLGFWMNSREPILLVSDVMFIIILGFGVERLIRRQGWKGPALTWCFLAPILGTIGFSLWKNIYYSDYTVIWMPMAWIIFAAGCVNIREFISSRTSWKLIGLLPILFCALFYLFGAYSWYAVHDFPQWREAGEIIDSRYRQGDMVIVNNSSRSIMITHYMKHKALVVGVEPESLESVINSAPNGIWYVQYYWWLTDPDNSILKFLKAHFARDFEVHITSGSGNERHPLDIWRFTRKTKPGS